MRILLVEDDEKIAHIVEDILHSAGYICDVAYSGTDGLEILKSSKGSYAHDAIILDRCLPDIDGLDDFIPRLRCRNIDCPVIFLSALCSVEHKVKALEFGADDYIVKPFNKHELLSRIRAIVRRTKGHTSSTFEIGNLVLDFHKQICKVKGTSKAIPLTNKEYSMLELLCLQGPGTVVSKEKFINHLYSNSEPSESKIIDVFVCKLRRKMAKATNGTNYIKTIWGRGYTIDDSADEDHNFNNNFSHDAEAVKQKTEDANETA